MQKSLENKIMMNSKPIYVIIPAYNEEETVGEVVEGLKKLDLNLKIIVVDDGSRDKTAEKAREAGAIVVRHSMNLGQWAALKTAFMISSLSGAEIVVTLDADGQHSPENLFSLIYPVLKEEADLVIGSRFLGQDKPHMDSYRYFGIKFFNKLMKLSTGLELSDCTSGYKVYRGDLVANLLPMLSENQYGALEVIIRSSRLSAKICERSIFSIPSNRSTKGNLKYAYNLLRTIFNSAID